jgi:phosphoenolpyruvate synthase/pyruvate phosphate dikinase
MNHYYKEEMVKMGRWALLPLDSENWHAEYTSIEFKKRFGFYKGTMVLHDTNENFQYAYFPKSYFKKLYSYITEINKKDYKALEKKLKSFYPLKDLTKKEIPKIKTSNYKKLSIPELIKLYSKNRDWAHKIAVFDQFGWVGEDYWNPLMETILVKKFGIKKNSPEFYSILFALTKPAQISTTLEEKRDILDRALKIKARQTTLTTASKLLAKKYGWMPVFTYGTPWDNSHYGIELKELQKQPKPEIQKQYNIQKNYTKIRNQEIRKLVTKYNIGPKDLQIFIDFGLALDTRNEAEYLISLCGYYVLPLYKEMAHRLGLSIKQLRCLYEHEIKAALRGKIDPNKRLREKGTYIGWGFNRAMSKRINFNKVETKKLLNYLEKRSKKLHGNTEDQGVCASPGIAEGKAKIIISPNENNKVKQGDILIAEATTVDYLPAMKRAAAFVTEIGGLTCHAAVVAREFGVPCIVGLKNATKMFKDNDMVMVDAGKGLVRKI